ncbi:helicase associated domain-containing protein [Kitasatospora sp. NPDC008115]|uniref:helicase associated domain-containing protein n=1 Tax=Kitasatospora sp. NPDC008115 TaxID=3364022 RepID=UPI0036E422D0
MAGHRRPGRLAPAAPGHGVRGRAARPLGTGAARAGWPDLEADQRDLLSAIGIEPDRELVAAKAAAEAKPTLSRGDRFAHGLAALAQFVEREGHARVPRTHKEGGVSLGTWLNNQKARRDKLTGEQLRQLEALGVGW